MGQEVGCKGVLVCSGGGSISLIGYGVWPVNVAEVGNDIVYVGRKIYLMVFINYC